MSIEWKSAKLTAIRESVLRLARPAILLISATHLSLYIFVMAPTALRGYADFIIFYSAGSIIAQGAGDHLYDSEAQWNVQRQCCPIPGSTKPLLYNHAPHEALFFVPLSLFSFRVAYVLWTLVNLGVLILILLVLHRELGGPGWPLLFLASIASFPVLILFSQGQDSLLLLLAYVGVFALLKAERPLVAGICLAFGSFKPQLVAPFVLILLLRKQWKVLSGFLIGGGIVAIISSLFVGRSINFDYVTFLLHFDQMPTKVAETHPGLMPNLRGLLITVFGSFLPGWAVTLLIILASVGVVWLAAASSRRDIESQFALALTATALASYHFYSHDAVLLLVPILLGAVTLRTNSARKVLTASALPWFLSPLLLLLSNYQLMGLLAIFVFGIGLAFWLELVHGKQRPAPSAGRSGGMVL